VTDTLPTDGAPDSAADTPRATAVGASPDTAPGTAAVAAPVPTAAPTAAERTVAEARRRIDDLDGRIIELVRQRSEVSGEVQQARMGAGGRRLHLAREMEILRTYGEALGRPGTALAMTLLELGRGKV
jgi:chorismate mutase